MSAAGGQDVTEERGTEYTDTQALPNYAEESSGAAPAYPAQTRTYIAQNRNWDMTSDYTASGLAATQFSWTRTESHN